MRLVVRIVKDAQTRAFAVSGHDGGANRRYGRLWAVTLELSGNVAASVGLGCYAWWGTHGIVIF
jgi:hypothetical protein